jgi:hypothetical protein
MSDGLVPNNGPSFATKVRHASEKEIDDALIIAAFPLLLHSIKHKPENTNELTSLPDGPDPITEKLSEPLAINVEFEIVRRPTADLPIPFEEISQLPIPEPCDELSAITVQFMIVISLTSEVPPFP